MNIANLEVAPAVVRDRFRWAFQQGNPRWLWPATSPQRWRLALKQIECATRNVLSGVSPSALLEGEPEDIGIAAFTSGMGPMLGYWISAGMLRVDAPLRPLLGLHYSQNRDRMRNLARSAQVAVEALHDAGAHVTILKGMHTAHQLFPNPACRPVSDIDLWVPAADEPVASRALEALGYLRAGASFGEQSWRLAHTPSELPSLSLVHAKGPWSIDLHRTLDRRYSPGAPMFLLDHALECEGTAGWPLSPKGEVLTGAGLIVHLAFHAGLGLGSL